MGSLKKDKNLNCEKVVIAIVASRERQRAKCHV